MGDKEINGTSILEKMASLGKIDEFFEAVDSDDLEKVKFLLRCAKFDFETIEVVIQKIIDGEEG